MKLINKKLKGKYVDVLPLENKHLELLKLAAKFDEIWIHNSSMSRFTQEGWKKWCKKAKRDKYQTYVFQDKKGNFIGSSRYYAINHEENHLSIGYTWYTPSVWGSKVNPECKYLLLKNAFDSGVNAVYFHTDDQNKHSIAAIEKLGAEYVKTDEAIESRLDGSPLNRLEYVITKKKWPQIEAMLQGRIISN